MSVAKKVPRSEAEGKAPVITAITRQASEDFTEAGFDQAALENIEGWIVKTMVQKAKVHYKESGYDPKNFNPRVDANSVYVSVNGKKLAVIKINFDDVARSINIMGFQGNELIRVSCFRNSNDDILVFSGECGSKIKEAFGVSLPSP